MIVVWREKSKLRTVSRTNKSGHVANFYFFTSTRLARKVRSLRWGPDFIYFVRSVAARFSFN
jgi:hypothetical protein